MSAVRFRLWPPFVNTVEPPTKEKHMNPFFSLLVAMIFIISLPSRGDDPDAPAVFAKPFFQVNFSSVNTTVDDLSSLKQLFVKLRDDRFLTWDEMPDFKRRIPWLYPKQGCSDRATLMRQHIEQLGLNVPMRVFAFPVAGTSLILKSPYWNTLITWSSYHTALITKVGNSIYVIDPLSSPLGPIPVSDWATQLGDGHIENVTLAICGPLSSSAERHCWEKDPNEAYKILIPQILLKEEWNSVQDLNPTFSHNPKIILGDHPPWTQ